MTNGKDYQKPCRDCGAEITMSNRSGRSWDAYNQDESLHRCRTPEWAKDKNNHGNDAETLVYPPATIATAATTATPTEQKTKQMPIKIMSSVHSDDLEETYARFGSKHKIVRWQYDAVALEGSIVHNLCVLYEAEE